MTSRARLDRARQLLDTPPPPAVTGQIAVPDGPRIGSLCTGYGGLDEAVQQVFGGSLAWVSDIDPGASRILAHHHPDIPNLGDLTDIDWSSVEPVDVLTGGYPCQPFSVAGQKKGTADERHIWPYIATAIRVLRPRLCLFENVANHVRIGLDGVLADLAAIGFDAEWTTVRASDVGAAHRRERLFLLAWPANAESKRGREGWAESAWQPGRLDVVRSRRATSYSSRPGLQGRGTEGAASDRRHDPSDTDRGRLPELPERDCSTPLAEGNDEHGRLHSVGRRIPHADAAHLGRERGGGSTGPEGLTSEPQSADSNLPVRRAGAPSGSTTTTASAPGALVAPTPSWVAPAFLPTPTANLGSNGGAQHPAKRRSGGHQPSIADVAEHLGAGTPPPSTGGNKSSAVPHLRRSTAADDSPLFSLSG
ncbi:DNA cytosine methyltransferase [Streptomyces sp. DT171]|uniref:DNA cytosine methyltransferase n=1 Tax=Streptomyces sp. DT171 TaxID=3416524 RepID=UPI003CFB6B7C